MFVARGVYHNHKVANGNCIMALPVFAYLATLAMGPVGDDLRQLNHCIFGADSRGARGSTLPVPAALPGDPY